MTQRLPFFIKQTTVSLAVQRGIHFELVYNCALKGTWFIEWDCLIPKDSNTRRNFISNAMQVVRALRGKNLIISSGASHWLDIRGPHDVANL